MRSQTGIASYRNPVNHSCPLTTRGLEGLTLGGPGVTKPQLVECHSTECRRSSSDFGISEEVERGKKTISCGSPITIRDYLLSGDVPALDYRGDLFAIEGSHHRG